MSAIGTVTYPTATTWQVEITELQPGVNPVTVSDGTDSIVLEILSATDSTTSSDSNTVEVVSPSTVAVSDTSTSTDSTSCVLVHVAPVSAPFLLAASFLVAVLWDSANADTGTASDSVVIASTARNTDAASQADTVTIRLDVPTSDATDATDTNGATVGAYSSASDSTTSEDAVTAELVTVSVTSDSTTSSDSVSLEFVSPDAVAVSDSTVATDSNTCARSIGHVDSTTSTDAAVGLIGLYSAALDSTTSTDSSTVSVGAAPSSDETAHAAIADAIVAGVLATDINAGMSAEAIAIGVLYGSPMSKIGQCYQGCDFPIFFPKVRDANGDAVDLTGATLRCYALIGAVPTAASSTSVNATKGTAQATFSAAQTNALTVGTTYGFDGVVTLADGTEYAIGKGNFIVRDPITPTP